MSNETWRILIADDNLDDRAEAQRALLNGSLRYYQFHEVETGAECLAALTQSDGAAFDCLLLDYHLPDRDAPEILRLLADRSGLPCPVVVMTGVTDRQMGLEVISAGAQDIISKQWINPESLTRVIENAIERQAILAERQRMTEALALAKAEADRANQSKSFFLANMSHEIRTPMNAIMCSTELCLEETLTDVQRGFLIKIQKASEALLHLINDILDFSKVEAGKLDLCQEAFTVSDLLDNLALIFESKAKEKGLELIFSSSTNFTSAFVGDRHRLGQVLINLIGNAIKFTAKGRVGIEVFQESSSNDSALLRFTVRDQGIGISPEAMAQLFQPFTQADASITRNFGGTGLGLALSKRLVEMMGGEIWAESVPGQGCTFHFTVRFDICASALGHEVQIQPQAQDVQERHVLNNKEILLVEDNEFNQELIGEVLKRAGLCVRVAGNGMEAIEAVKQSVPDAVLMDCQMPVMDGLEATRLLREQEALRALPIIALTANAMTEDRENCRRAGMDDFVSKPVRKDELLSVLARWVGDKGDI